MAKTDLHNKWLALRAMGLSYRKIEQRLGVSKQTQIKWAKKFANELQALKSKELESINERLGIAKKHRIERLANQLERIEEELDKRDISDMTTANLIKEFTNLVKTIHSETGEAEPSREMEIDDSLRPYLEIMSRITGGKGSEK